MKKMEYRPSTSSGNFREQILSSLEARNASVRPWAAIFKNYSLMSDELIRIRRRFDSRGAPDTADTATLHSSPLELKQLREELAEVYKQKSRNDQSLIEANRKLDQHDAALNVVTKECALLETKTSEILHLQQERLVLINKIRDLNEQHANIFNTEVDLQQDLQNLQQSTLPIADVVLGDAVPREIVFKAEANDGEVYDVLWLSVEMFASGGSDKRVRLWRVDHRGRPSKVSTLVGCNHSVTRLDFDHESRLLLGASNDNGVRLWNVDNQRLMSSFMGHTDKVSSARFLSSTQVVSGSNDRLIKLWDVRSQRCIRSVFPGSTILDIVGLKRGVATFASGHFDRKLRFWDSRNQEPVHSMEMAGKITALDMSSDGINLLCSTRDDTLSLLDIRKYQTVHIYSAEHYRTSNDLSRCVLSPGMGYCAAGSMDGHVFIWNVQSTKLEKVLHKGGHDILLVTIQSANRSGSAPGAAPVFMRLLFLLSISGTVFSWDSEHTTPSVELTSADYADSLQDTSVAGSSKKLTEYLLARHNVNAPPDGLLDVHYEMELVHILGIDELKQTMTVLVYVDEVPDYIILWVRASRLHHEDLLSSVRAPALIYPNGTVEASHPAVYTVTCEINIKRFPLDDQRCALEIASWTYGKDKIRLRAHTEHSLQHYTDNEEWRLLKVTVIEDEYEHEGINVSELRYDVSVKRRPLFYMVTLTFPSYVMCAISVVGLFARFSTTGEREVTCLNVFRVAYFLFNMVMVSLAAMTTGLVMRVHRMGRYGKEPKEWLLRLFCLRPFKTKDIYTVCSDSPLRSSSCLKGLNDEFRDSQPIAERIPVLESYIRKLVHTCENIQGEIDDFDVDDPTAIRRRREANGYVRISERLDLFFMSFFLTLVTIPVIALFYQT
ncbi:hypothetical protein GCK32_002278 [Trichostrongylus colubriformis]|uniref:Neurotransmitter-gated ion-channel ligand-binding domain-containing protein n=1 Tax=Trichostrongylus colubriformis TaxID=6319 RepID=A0AAN8FMF7_TRICO